jgi:hypothetical protein
MDTNDILLLEKVQRKRRNDLRREFNQRKQTATMSSGGGAKRKRNDGNSMHANKVHGEKNQVQREIVQQFDRRSFHRIQMQIPFGESSIIFLTETSKPETSSFWTNMLVHLVSHDVRNNGGKVFFPKGTISWGDGLVQLPDLLNIGRKKSIVNPVLHRILDGRTSTGLADVDRLIDDMLEKSPDIMNMKGHSIALNNPKPSLTWYCPRVPPGGIVVWHGFHTTKGDSRSQFRPKATLFLDYAERNLLQNIHFKEYIRLLKTQPFDPGAGSGNTRGSRTTIEFNAAKNTPQASPSLQVNARMVGGDVPGKTVGRLTITKEDVLRQGFAVIAPVLPGQPTPKDCNRWEMSEAELGQYNELRNRTKEEFERFLTYHIFERELRFLACWLSTYTNFKGYKDLWADMKTQVDLFDDRGQFVFKKRAANFKKSEFMPTLVKAIEDEGNDPAEVKGYTGRVEKTLSEAQYTLFMALTLHKVAKNSRRLNVTAARQGMMDKNYEDQERCWKALFGGIKLTQRQAAVETFNDPFFMYWRYRMGNSKNMMCNGTTLTDVNEYVEKKVKDGFFEHYHGRNPQAGGMKITKTSGMGGATTYVAGEAHINLQVGEFGNTLAQAFYKDPIVVMERFRVKTHASWGAGHVDHAVDSRLRDITYV